MRQLCRSPQHVNMAESRVLCLVLRLLLLLHILGFSSAYTALSDESLKNIPVPGDDFDIDSGKLLSPILQPRVPGTPGSLVVLEHFTTFFRDELPQWKISYQNSTSKTPMTGDEDIPFRNLIVRRDPPWSKSGEVGYLTLVAHYDSKMEPEGFIGAIDSALPCAVLMHAARSLDGALTSKWASAEAVGLKEDEFDDEFQAHNGVQIIFLDGEEAFAEWTSTDSVYGARSLAKDMEETYHPALSTYQNELSSISLFVLLDLLGSADPSIPSYYKTTHWAYQKMAAVEQRLRKSGKLRTRANTWFPEMDKKSTDIWIGGAIGDDHVPFIERGVDVLHIIPARFPHVWHKITDDGEHLDMQTCEDWAVVTTAFAAEWMDLEGHFVSGPTKAPHLKERQVTSKTEL